MNLDEFLIEDSKKEEFNNYISTKKCPFRTYADGAMKYCDPYCMALICDNNYNYSCMRLMNINYSTPKMVFIESKV